MTKDELDAILERVDIGMCNGALGSSCLKDRKALLAEVGRLTAEVAFDNALLAERQRVLDALPCPVHGPCVPYAIEKIEWLRAEAERLDEALRTRPVLLLCEHGADGAAFAAIASAPIELPAFPRAGDVFLDYREGFTPASHPAKVRCPSCGVMQRVPAGGRPNIHTQDCQHAKSGDLLVRKVDE